ncbi:toxin-antitoxin system YwqK family antitoxin [Sediminicola sp. 1XM1-17]|uniref:toxin-antitoxin system YwqK family antitoxin n=1 Tax=Sediminicola sp. 1XM1-17 TaxID=3127702 RepID=UPI003077B617
MKVASLVFAFIFSLVTYAQTPEPNFVKVGDMVKATYFHENGIVSQSGHFLNGKLHGEWTMYDEKGEKIALGSYVEGQKTGKWFFWQADGLQEVDFVDSRIAEVIQWDKAGKLVIN